jgi:hypothetical protein
VNYVISVIHKVADLTQAENFLIDQLGFKSTAAGDGWVELDNGALGVKLLQSDVADCSELNFNISCSDFEDTLEKYQKQGFKLVSQPFWSAASVQQAYLRGPHHLHLTIFREYDEDELDILPELPTSIDWSADARKMIRQLLKSVPVSFRELARVRVTDTAESNTIVAGETEVSLPLALQSMVQVTPGFQHEGLKAEMNKNGIDPEDYFIED